MISEQAIKERAMQIDPCAFKSYSGSARRDAQQEALEQARRELDGEARGPRRYSIDEIDRMRKAICRMQRFNPFERPMREPSVETQLRTAMIGGVSPQELEDKADEFWARIRERREARRREQEADAARVYAGGRPINVTAEAEAVVADAPLNSFWRRIIVSRIEVILGRLRGRSI